MGTGVVTKGRLRLAPLLLGLVLVTIAAGAGLQGVMEGAGSMPAPDLGGYPWFYLRVGRPLAADERLVELVAVGDVMPGRGVAAIEAPLAQVAPWLSAADLALGNLEAVLVAAAPDAVSPAQEPYLLWAQPAAGTMLARAGFDLLSLANNHSLDAGSDGLQETAANLVGVGIAPLGAGAGDDADAPVLRTVRGVRLAFLAFNAVAMPGAKPDAGGWAAASWDEARAVAAVAAARAEADAVIATVHWGYEYEPRADPAQMRIANVLWSAGVDLIVGHHPHVVQPVGMGTPHGAVAYSLGNFLFDQGQGETGEGLALRAFFDRDGLRAIQALPLAAGPRPRLLPLDEAETLLARVAPPPVQHRVSCSDNDCIPLTRKDGGEPPSGLFWSGEIDLTGDGEPELVRRAAEQVTIYSEGSAVWQSPAEWRVVDAALGDPNDDGRAEILLALRRSDTEGYERSQPYIVGYRGGEYQVLWGGRAVVAPILEVELGDVNGDGAEELVVLEAQSEGTTIGVWRWQGWSFSLVWRSEPGQFRNLLLQPVDDRMLLVVEASLN
ncbi:MAG: CapA family protein [Anaerolineae bacterium]|nr:CapA family protein [Anaerolineae bacterium]